MGTRYENVSLYAEHLEDAGPGPDHQRPDSVEKSAGELEVGALIDGTKFVLFRVPAGRFLKDQRLAKEAQEKQQSEQPVEQQQGESEQSQQGYQQPPSY